MNINTEYINISIIRDISIELVLIDLIDYKYASEIDSVLDYYLHTLLLF